MALGCLAVHHVEHARGTPNHAQMHALYGVYHLHQNRDHKKKAFSGQEDRFIQGAIIDVCSCAPGCTPGKQNNDKELRDEKMWIQQYVFNTNSARSRREMRMVRTDIYFVLLVHEHSLVRQRV